MEEALAIHGTITGRYNDIRRGLDTEPQGFDPVFRKGPEGEVSSPTGPPGSSRACGFARRRGSR